MALHHVIAWSLFAFLAADMVSAAGSVYSAHLAYDSGKLTLIEMHVTEGFADAGMDNGPLECRLVSADGEVVNRLKFGIPIEICYDEIDPETGGFRGGCITLNKTEFRLFVPYDSRVGRMEFYDENNSLVLGVDLSEDSGPVEPINTGFDVSGFFPYALAVVLLVAACFVCLRKRERRRLAKKRADFEGGKAGQGKKEGKA